MINLSNPCQDDTLNAEQQEVARSVIHQLGAAWKQLEGVMADSCEEAGVPEEVFMRALIQLHLHKAGTEAAHLIAQAETNPAEESVAMTDIMTRLHDVVVRQLPLSKETWEGRVGGN